MPFTIDPVTGQLTQKKVRAGSLTDPAGNPTQASDLTTSAGPTSASTIPGVSTSGPVASQPLTTTDPSVTATLPGTSGGVDPTTGQVTYYNPYGNTASSTPVLGVSPSATDPSAGQFTNLQTGTTGPSIASVGPSASTAFNFSQYSDPKAGMLAALNSGQFSDPEALVQAANQAYGLGYGASFANYAQKGVIANAPSAGGGYFAKGPDGKWGWNPGDSGGGQTTTTTAALQPGAVTGTQMDPQLHQAILDLLQRGTTPVSASDPTIKGIVDAANVTGQRGLSATQAALAERAAYTGAPTSTVDQGVAAAGEALGQNLQGLQSNLMLTELNNRRQDVVNALSFAQGQDAQALQLQLRQIDDAIARAQLGQQNQQFYDQLGVNIGTNTELMNLENTLKIALGIS